MAWAAPARVSRSSATRWSMRRRSPGLASSHVPRRRRRPLRLGPASPTHRLPPCCHVLAPFPTPTAVDKNVGGCLLLSHDPCSDVAESRGTKLRHHASGQEHKVHVV